ncbi:MAG TPA: hypothetical protein VMS76_11300, partial [Planctomycetota bacterium]|nr:hypothetical protein [Planctomycetota bacterium]
SGQVQYLNKRLGLFFDRLQEMDRFDSSLIIVHGDHGLRTLELGQEDGALEGSVPIDGALQVWEEILSQRRLRLESAARA